MLSNMKYERVERQYEVFDPNTGEVETFPRGRHGRRNAMRRAVHFQNPRLHRIVTKLVQRSPQLESRAWRGAELLLGGAVKEPYSQEALASVTGSSEYGDYLVASRNGMIICDCLDYMEGNAPYYNQNGQRLCKHILAVQFTRRLQYRHCGSCSRKVEADLMICPFCNGEVTPY
jgi:hypothetical protein